MRRLIRGLLLLALTGAAAYGYGYQRGTHQSPVTQTEPTSEITSAAEPEPVADTKSDESAAIESAAVGGGEVTDQGVVHTIQTGETLFTIGLKYDVLWTTIATANGIDEYTPLIAGHTLTIPIGENGSLIKEETLSIDQAEVSAVQTKVNNGELVWRLDPLATVRQSTPLDYHLKNDDTYTLTSFDVAAGTAEVNITHDAQRLTIQLIQPGEKGEAGVWFIATIKRVQ